MGGGIANNPLHKQRVHKYRRKKPDTNHKDKKDVYKRQEQYMEQQTIQLRQQLGSIAQIERLGEGIKITFQSAILYPEGSYVLSNDPQQMCIRDRTLIPNFKTAKSF